MGAYKFCRPEVVSFIIKGGSIRVSRLSFFEQMEEEEQKAGIGDRLERRSITRVEDWRIPQVGEREQEILKSLGIGASRAAANIIIENCTFESRTEDVFVFCYSVGEYEELKRTMNERHPEYTSCVEIMSPQRFAHHLHHRGSIPHIGNIKVSQIFARKEQHAITYGPVVTEFSGNPMRQPSPFYKDTFFSYQREARLVLWPWREREPLPAYVDITIPKPEQLFRLVE